MERIKVDRSVAPYEHFVELPYYDIEQVERELGAARFSRLMAGVKEVVSCGHRNHPEDHPDKLKASTEVHCLHAADVEDFLKREQIHLVEAK